MTCSLRMVDDVLLCSVFSQISIHNLEAQLFLKKKKKKTPKLCPILGGAHLPLTCMKC